MAVVTVEEVEEYLGRPLTETEKTRAEMDIAAAQEQLQAWCRRKFESGTIYDEKHIIPNAGSIYSLFLHWGDPTGDVLVAFGAPTNTQRSYPGASWRTEFYYHYLYLRNATCFVTYQPDLRLVNLYLNTIKQVIIDATIQKLMLPPAVRFKIVNSYSVEGLSVNYGANGGQSDGATKTATGNFTDIDLTPLMPLKRRIIL